LLLLLPLFTLLHLFVLVLEVDVGLLLGHLDVQEDYNAGNIIDDIIFLLLPLQVRFSHDGFGRLLCVLALEIRHDDLRDLLVRQELPDTVTCQHYESVVRAQVELEDLWLGSHSNLGSYLITEGASHCKTRNIFVLQPHSERADGVVIRVPEGVNAAAILQNSCSFVGLAGLLITGDGLSDYFAGHVALLLLHDNASRVTNIRAEKLLTESEDRYTSTSTETNIEGACEELIVAIQEGVIESDADFVSVEELVLLVLLKIFSILLQHVANLTLQVQGQLLLHVATDLLSVLTMAVSN